MPFTTYTELKAALATRLHRSDLTANIIDYITLAEKRLNRVLKLSAQETEATLTATVSSRTLTPPNDFGRPIALYQTTNLPRSEVTYKLPTAMQVLNSNGPASSWTIDGVVIKTDAPADIAYTYSLRYASEYDIASTSTNTLLTKYPDLYFYGAIIEAGNDLKDDAQIARAEKRYAQALQECINAANATRSIATLSTDLSGTPTQNIITGD